MAIDASVPYRIVISPQDNGETAVKQAKNWSSNFANDVQFTQATTTDNDVVFVAYDTHEDALDDMLSAGHETPSTVGVLLIPSGNAKEGELVDLSEHVVVHEIGSDAPMQGDAESFEEVFGDQYGDHVAARENESTDGTETETETETDTDANSDVSDTDAESHDGAGASEPKHAARDTPSAIIADEGAGLVNDDDTTASDDAPSIIGDVAPEFKVPEERPVDEVINDAREELSKAERVERDEAGAYDQSLGFAVDDVVPNNVTELGDALVPHTDATAAETEALDDMTRAQIESLVENANVSLAGTYDTARVVIGEDFDFGLTKRELLEQFYSEPSDALSSHAESLGSMRDVQDDVDDQIAFVTQSYRDAEDQWVAKQVESLRAMYRAQHPDRTDEIIKKINEAASSDFSEAAKRANKTWQPAVYDVLKRLRDLPESAVTTTAIQLAMTRQRLQQQLDENVQNVINEARESGRLAKPGGSAGSDEIKRERDELDELADEQNDALLGRSNPVASSFEKRGATERDGTGDDSKKPVAHVGPPVASTLVANQHNDEDRSVCSADASDVVSSEGSEGNADDEADVIDDVEAEGTPDDKTAESDDDDGASGLDGSPSEDSSEQDVKLDPETGEPIDFDEDAAVANEATSESDTSADGSIDSSSLDDLDGTGEDNEEKGAGFKSLSSKQKKMTLGIAGGVLALGVLFTGFVTPGFFTSNEDGDGETNQTQSIEGSEQDAAGERETDVNEKYRVGDTLRVVLDGRGITSVQITSFGDDGGAIAADSAGSKVTLSQTILDNYVDRNPELFKNRTDADSVKDDNPLRGDE